HHFVFVSVMRKSEKLGNRLIEDAERMGKIDAPIDSNRGALAYPPSSACKIAKSVDRNRGSPFKRRDMKGRGQMGRVMLHSMNLPFEGAFRSASPQQSCSAHPRSPIHPPAPSQSRIRALRHNITYLT